MRDADYSLPGEPTSLWLDTTPESGFPPLQEGLTVDVAIVGGGLAGLTAATLLKAEGKSVAVLEAGRIVQGVTGYTTAKVTSLHGLIYADLVRHFGDEKARAYAEANQAAIEQIASLIQAKQIDCDFVRTEAYTYTESGDERDKIIAEVEAAIKLGLPATFTDETALPFPVKGAVRFDNQAQFHPRKYLLALARDIPGDGSAIFEETRVLGVEEGEPCVVTTDRGTIAARSIIVASHYPFGDRLLYAFRLHPHRSYVLAVRVAQPLSRGMFISTEPSHSVRSYPAPGSDMLLVGGEGHKAGQGGDTVARYQRLEQWARERFDVQSVAYRWSTQDNSTLDGVPYIGRYGPTSRHLYVATGFGGWGMTNGTVAGMLLRDLILERDNSWSSVFDPNRVKLTGLSDLVGQVGDIAKHFVGDRMTDATVEDIAPGEGKIVDTPNGKAAMYKGEDGTLHALSAACTHMGCFVLWNPAEKSWDCPCHGSRFATDGQVLHGPANEALQQLGEAGESDSQ